MSIVTKNKAKAAQKLIVLKHAKKINSEDLVIPEWEALQKEYSGLQDGEWVDKAILSVLNSIIFQRRVVFVLTKRAVRDLAQSDLNWTKPIGLKDTNYSKLIQQLTTREILKVVHKSTNGCWVYELIEPDILAFLNIDVAAQRAEAIEFADDDGVTPELLAEAMSFMKGTTQGTSLGNREGGGEKEEEKELETLRIESKLSSGENKSIISSPLNRNQQTSSSPSYSKGQAAYKLSHPILGISVTPSTNTNSDYHLVEHTIDWMTQFQSHHKDIKKQLFGMHNRRATLASYLNALESVGTDLSDKLEVARIFNQVVVLHGVGIKETNEADVLLQKECETELINMLLMRSVVVK